MELVEEMAAELLEEGDEGPGVTMEIGVEEILETIALATPTSTPTPTPTPAVVAPPIAAQTRELVRELPEGPSTASAVRPFSESTWSVAALVDDEILPRRSSGWMRYTLVSAGATALVCSLGFALASEPAPASAAARAAEPTLIAYDPSSLAGEAEVEVAAPSAQAEHDVVLARRVALRGTRNLEAGRTRLARQAFEQALSHDPECRPALAGLGRIHFAAGRHEKAAGYLAPAVRIEPRDAELQGMLAQAYRAIGHHQSAARHERLATRHDG